MRIGLVPEMDRQPVAETVRLSPLCRVICVFADARLDLLPYFRGSASLNAGLLFQRGAGGVWFSRGAYTEYSLSSMR
jgi:hypothetical protein